MDDAEKAEAEALRESEAELERLALVEAWAALTLNELEREAEAERLALVDA